MKFIGFSFVAFLSLLSVAETSETQHFLEKACQNPLGFSELEDRLERLSPNDHFDFGKSNMLSSKKIYVDFKDIVVDSKGFWIQPLGSNFLIGASSLHTDENGTYLASGVRWICPYADCRAVNEDISNPVCQSCLRVR